MVAGLTYPPTLSLVPKTEHGSMCLLTMKTKIKIRLALSLTIQCAAAPIDGEVQEVFETLGPGKSCVNLTGTSNWVSLGVVSLGIFMKRIARIYAHCSCLAVALLFRIFCHYGGHLCDRCVRWPDSPLNGKVRKMSTVVKAGGWSVLIEPVGFVTLERVFFHQSMHRQGRGVGIRRLIDGISLGKHGSRGCCKMFRQNVWYFQIWRDGCKLMVEW